jgi:hypothetical protein
MDNPYTPPPSSNLPNQTSGPFPTSLMALLPLVVIAANYTTATSIRWDVPDIFGHVVFFVAPVSFLIHVPNLFAKPTETLSTATRWSFLAILLIPASFALSISPISSSNPYESFVATNKFFGPYSWMLYTWLIVLGILPLFELIPVIRRSRLTMSMLSLIAIIFHIHNAYWIWKLCHL